MSGSGILLLFLVSTLIFLLMGLALVLYVMQYQRRMMQQEETLQEQERLHQEKLLQATIDSQEKERTRMASNLHDGVGALLSAVRLRVLMRGGDFPEEKAFAEETAAMLQESIQEVREISHDLLPGPLKEYGLFSALRELANRISRSTMVQVKLEEQGEGQRLPERDELAIYRVCQELINNTLRHAEANLITLEIEWEEGQLNVNYADDGIGFPAGETSEGLGMYTIRSRLQALQGEVHLESNPGEGVQCRVSVPLEN